MATSTVVDRMSDDATTTACIARQGIDGTVGQVKFNICLICLRIAMIFSLTT